MPSYYQVALLAREILGRSHAAYILGLLFRKYPCVVYIACITAAVRSPEHEMVADVTFMLNIVLHSGSPLRKDFTCILLSLHTRCPIHAAFLGHPVESLQRFYKPSQQPVGRP